MDTAKSSRPGSEKEDFTPVKAEEEVVDVAVQLSAGYGESISEEDALRIRFVLMSIPVNEN